MNHDITHCSGEDVCGVLNEQVERIICPKRKNCHRYMAYLDLRNIENTMVSMLMPQSCIDNDYHQFWSEKEYNKKP